MQSIHCSNSGTDDKAYETSFHSVFETLPRVEAEGNSADDSNLMPPLEPCDTHMPAIEPVSQVVTIPSVEPAIHNTDIPEVGRRTPSISDASFDTGKAVKVCSAGDSSEDAVVNKKVSFHDENDEGAATDETTNKGAAETAETAETAKLPGSGSRSGFDAGVPMAPSTHAPSGSKKKEGVLHRILRLIGGKHGPSGN